MRLKPPSKIHRFLEVAVAGLLLLSGCMSLFHPQAEEWYQQAKGATGRQTALTLISLMETTAQQATTEAEGRSALPALNDLHHQFHALHQTFCDFSDESTSAPAYEHALTLHEELRTILHRLWKLQANPPLRDIHVHLFLSRLQELHKAVHAIPA